MAITGFLNNIFIPIILVLLPLLWGLTDWMIKRSQFLKLMFRELEEIGPCPERMDSEHPKKHWSEHHNNKRYLHKEILMNPDENRDFILSLPADVVYHVTQLWNFTTNGNEWLYHLSMLETKIPVWQKKRRREVKMVIRAWYVLMKEYGEEVDKKYGESSRLK